MLNPNEASSRNASSFGARIRSFLSRTNSTPENTNDVGSRWVIGDYVPGIEHSMYPRNPSTGPWSNREALQSAFGRWIEEVPER